MSIVVNCHHDTIILHLDICWCVLRLRLQLSLLDLEPRQHAQPDLAVVHQPPACQTKFRLGTDVPAPARDEGADLSTTSCAAPVLFPNYRQMTINADISSQHSGAPSEPVFNGGVLEGLAGFHQCDLHTTWT